LGLFDEEEDAAQAYDRMAVWFQLHGIVRKKPGGSTYDWSSVKASLNFAYDEYEGEFDELRRMSQDECVQSLRQQGVGKRKRKRPESAADTHLELVEGGGGRDGGGDMCMVGAQDRGGGGVGAGDGGGGGGRGGSVGGDGGTAAGEVARQERTHTSQYRGVHWNRDAQSWHVQFKHSNTPIYLGLFDDEKDAAWAHDRMAVWFDLHGVVRIKDGGARAGIGVHDLSSVKDSLNFAYDEYKGELDELRRMTQEECVQSLRQQAKDKRKRRRLESAADTCMALVGGRGKGRSGGGKGDGNGSGSGGDKRKRMRLESAADMQMALIRGGGDVGGDRDGGGGSGGDGAAADRARVSVAEARAEAAEAGRHPAEMQLNAGFSQHCLPRHSPQFTPPFIELTGFLSRASMSLSMIHLSHTQDLAE